MFGLTNLPSHSNLSLSETRADNFSLTFSRRGSSSGSVSIEIRFGWFCMIILPFQLEFVVQFDNRFAVLVNEFLARHVRGVLLHLNHPVFDFTHRPSPSFQRYVRTLPRQQSGCQPC